MGLRLVGKDERQPVEFHGGYEGGGATFQVGIPTHEEMEQKRVAFKHHTPEGAQKWADWFVCRFMRGWQGLDNDDGNPLEYPGDEDSEERRRICLDVYRRLPDSYSTRLTGVARGHERAHLAAAGNSKRS